MDKLPQEYNQWLKEVKARILTSRLKAAVAVNRNLIQLYWDIGFMIWQKQQNQGWGAKVIDQMAKDLKKELPDNQGFSRSNLYSIRKFYDFYANSKMIHQDGGQNPEMIHQAGGQLQPTGFLLDIPWRHHVSILNKVKTIEEAVFYIAKTTENNWSRNVLEMQIDSGLYNRQGKAVTNFKDTLPAGQSDLASETLKNPYVFDFLTLTEDVQELELEKKLIDNITRFLLELGVGFAYMGRQFPMKIGQKERRLDLLFYHTRLHCYVVFDLKIGDFEPEFAGKMNYYLSAVDEQLKSATDQPSIGIILCKSSNSVEVEYSLRGIQKPMGISEYTFGELPENLKANLPSEQQIINEMNKFE